MSFQITIQDLPADEAYLEGVNHRTGMGGATFSVMMALGGIERPDDPEPGYYHGLVDANKLHENLTAFLRADEAEQLRRLAEVCQRILVYCSLDSDGKVPMSPPRLARILPYVEDIAKVSGNAVNRGKQLAYSG